MHVIVEGIFILSGQDLSKEELAVLDKGLTYAPTQNLNTFDTYIGICKYIRKINIKKAILSNPQTRETTLPPDTSMVQHTSLRNKSFFNP